MRIFDWFGCQLTGDRLAKQRRHVSTYGAPHGTELQSPIWHQRDRSLPPFQVAHPSDGEDSRDLCHIRGLNGTATLRRRIRLAGGAATGAKQPTTPSWQRRLRIFGVFLSLISYSFTLRYPVLVSTFHILSSTPCTFVPSSPCFRFAPISLVICI